MDGDTRISHILDAIDIASANPDMAIDMGNVLRQIRVIRKYIPKPGNFDQNTTQMFSVIRKEFEGLFADLKKS